MNRNIRAGDFFFPPLTALLRALAYLTIFLVGLRYAYYQVFYSFSPFDDEGTMMHVVRMFVENTASYDFLKTVYGPFYYLHKYAIYGFLQADVSHDITRLTTIAFWGLIALVGAYFVHRLTRSLFLAVVVQMQLILHLSPLTGSPGHPQEIALFTIFSALLLSSVVGSRRFVGWSLVGMGAALGALVLIKVNLGIFMSIPLAFSILAFLPRNFFVRTLLWLVAIAALCLPIVIMWRHVQAASLGQNFCAVVVFSIAACLIASSQSRDNALLRWKDAWVAVGGVILFSACICIVIAILGGSFSAIADAVIFRALGFSGGYYTPLLIFQSSVYASVGSVLLALCYRFLGPKILNHHSMVVALSIVKLIYGCIVLFYAYQFPMFMLFAPFPVYFMWIVLVDTGNTKGAFKHQFPRVFLCLLAVFQILQAYPIAGAQAAWAGILLIPLAAICIGDAFPLVWAEIRRGLKKGLGWSPNQHFGTVFLALGVCFVCIWYYYKADIPVLEQRYWQGQALEMPGASKVRLPQREAMKLRKLVSDIKAHCDGFVALPGFSSLYFWTEIPPPGNISAAWMISMEDERQIEIVKVMEAYQRPCAIYNNRAKNTWVKGKLDYSEGPLVHYINSQFEEIRNYGLYSLHAKAR